MTLGPILPLMTAEAVPVLLLAIVPVKLIEAPESAVNQVVEFVLDSREMFPVPVMLPERLTPELLSAARLTPTRWDEMRRAVF